ncbi:MAG TPA: type III-A CRISPR-associated protein Csm2 [Ruminococcus flavefaciens]|nr:type III-A CRISPR-associated protein Csm2 [Ruminococcus flavefaciens]
MVAYNPNNNYTRNNQPRQQEAEIHKFDVSKLNADNYVDKAEEIIKAHKDAMDRDSISTSQIRNLLDLLNGLRERLRTERVTKLTEDMKGQVQYIKLRFVYAAGRDKDSKGVRDFIQRSGMIACLDTVKDSVKQYELVCKYMEALVAYHKYYINK